jgi:hypothetical protein
LEKFSYSLHFSPMYAAGKPEVTRSD